MTTGKFICCFDNGKSWTSVGSLWEVSTEDYRRLAEGLVDLWEIRPVSRYPLDDLRGEDAGNHKDCRKPLECSVESGEALWIMSKGLPFQVSSMKDGTFIQVYEGEGEVGPPMSSSFHRNPDA